MLNYDFDVCVAGNGPAGMIAARQLSLAGLSVIIIGSPNHQMHKFGETLAGAAIRLLLKLGLKELVETLLNTSNDNNSFPPKVTGNMAFWGTEQASITDAIHDPYGLGLRIDRQRFDTLLKQYIQLKNITHLNASITNLTKQNGLWKITLDGKMLITSKWIIDATGRSAKILKLLGVQRYRGAPLVALYRTCVPEKNISLNKTIISSNESGWLYAGKISEEKWVLGFHTLPKFAFNLRNHASHWDDVINKKSGITDLLGQLELSTDIYTHDVRTTWSSNSFGEGWVACGDALLAFDPIAGQGLFNAIYTAIKASEHILSAEQKIMLESNYLREIQKIIKVYEHRRYSLYIEEQRWLDSAFWKVHQYYQ